MGDEPIFRINVLHQRIQKENCGRCGTFLRKPRCMRSLVKPKCVFSPKNWCWAAGSLRARRSRRRRAFMPLLIADSLMSAFHSICKPHRRANDAIDRVLIPRTKNQGGHKCHKMSEMPASQSVAMRINNDATLCWLNNAIPLGCSNCWHLMSAPLGAGLYKCTLIPMPGANISSPLALSPCYCLLAENGFAIISPSNWPQRQGRRIRLIN